MTGAKCPTCDSPSPHLHPAVQHEGEVQLCHDAFHQRVTPENGPEKIAEIQALLAGPYRRAESELDRLNREVTGAILRAERLPDGSPEACEAFRYVAELEEELAMRTKADTVEGAVCRLGAVRAALSAGRPLHALGSARGYLAESLPAGVRERMQALRDLAQQAFNEVDGR